MGLVASLVHGHLGELEGVDDVVDLLDTILGTLIGLLGGSVGTGVCRGKNRVSMRGEKEGKSYDKFDVPKVSPPTWIMAQSAS